MPISSHSRDTKYVKMKLLDLPRETIVNILKHVTVFDLIFRVKLICKSFYELSYESSLFRQLDLTYQNVRDNNVIYSNINFIKHLQIVGEYVRSISAGFNDSEEEIPPCDASWYEAVLMENVFHYIPNMNALRLFGLDKMKVTTLDTLLRKYTNLEELTFSLTITSPEDIPQLFHLSQNQTVNLKKLCITIGNNCDAEDVTYHHNLTDVFIQVLKKNTRLQNLRIVFDFSPSEEIIPVLFGSNGVKIKELHWATSLYFPRASLSSIVGSSALTSLSLDDTRVNDAVMQRIARGCFNLKSLSVRGCSLLTDIGISHVGKHCNLLQRLIVNENMYGRQCNNITNVGLQAIADGCSDLATLVINHCPEVSDVGVVGIATNCPNLREIHIEGCLLVADEGVTALANHCHALQVVNLKLCLKITDKPVCILVENCPHLCTLLMESCHYISQLKFDRFKKMKTAFSMHIENKPNDAMSEDINIIGLDKASLQKEFQANNTQRSIGSEREWINLMSQKNDSVGQGKNILVNNSSLTEDLHNYNKQNEQEDMETENRTDNLNSQTAVVMDVCETNGTEIKTKDIRKSVYYQFDDVKNNADIPSIDSSTKIPKTRYTMASIFEESKLCKGSAHSHIRVLHLSFCSLLVDQSLRQFAKHLPDLLDLSLRSCYHITDSAVRCLLQGCRRLQKLDLSGGSTIQGTKLTDESLSAIAEFGQRLEELAMLKNEVITRNGIQQVLTCCPVFRYMCVSGGGIKGNIQLEELKEFTKTIQNRQVTITQDAAHIRSKGSVRINISCRGM